MPSKRVERDALAAQNERLLAALKIVVSIHHAGWGTAYSQKVVSTCTAALAETPAASLAAVKAGECRRLAEAIRAGHALNAAFHAAWIDGEAARIEGQP